jgi:hypothetical protein
MPAPLLPQLILNIPIDCQDRVVLGIVFLFVTFMELAPRLQDLVVQVSAVAHAIVSIPICAPLILDHSTHVQVLAVVLFVLRSRSVGRINLRWSAKETGSGGSVERLWCLQSVPNGTYIVKHDVAH